MKITRSPGLSRGFAIDPQIPAALILRPVGLLTGCTARHAVTTGQARPLAGGPMAFNALEVFLRREDGVEIATATISALEDWSTTEGKPTEKAVMGQLTALTKSRAPIAGLSMDQPRLMGVINVTPDSFSDGGRWPTIDAAVAHGRALRDAGADILDIGGESTRPGSDPVSVDEELQRVLPVVEHLAADGALVSIDTRRAAVMRAACDAGARVINDVSALTGPGALQAAKETGAAIVLMHMRGAPRTMQDAPVYDHAPYEITRYLMDRVAACVAAGIPREAIVVDPGIGFGKTVAHNLQVLEQLNLFHATGCAVLIGASRKSFIGFLTDCQIADRRVPGSLAVASIAVSQGVQFHRVHDVAETRQAVTIARAISDAAKYSP